MIPATLPSSFDFRRPTQLTPLRPITGLPAIRHIQLISVLLLIGLWRWSFWGIDRQPTWTAVGMRTCILRADADGRHHLICRICAHQLPSAGEVLLGARRCAMNRNPR